MHFKSLLSKKERILVEGDKKRWMQKTNAQFSDPS